MFRSYEGQHTVTWRQRRTVHRRTVIWRHTATVHGRPDSRAPRPNQLPRSFSLVLSSHSQSITLKVLPLSRQFIATIGTFEATLFFFLWRCGPTRGTASPFLRFLDHTQRRITVGRTPLDAWPARRRDLYLTTHNNHNRQTSIHPCPRWDSKPQSQQTSGRRPTP